jgi:aminoglycoside phosphotransferase (APT) family kinase protein
MASRPTAEVDVTAALVARLLRAQHPDLADLPILLVDNGWDNAVVRLGPDLAVRLPRRAVAVPLLRGEQRWLPVLAPRLPVPVPSPVRRGRPSPAFPWPWSVVPWFDGTIAADLPPADRRAWASALADVVVDLHAPAPRAAPVNPVRGGPLAGRDGVVRRRLQALPTGDRARLLALWERLARVPGWARRRTWIHGDLHPANLVTADGALRAVLDFGDLAAGDRATDLATAWLTFDGPGRADFRARVQERRPADPATWRRARGWALVMGSAMSAHADDDPRIAACGRHALAQVLLPEQAAAGGPRPAPAGADRPGGNDSVGGGVDARGDPAPSRGDVRAGMRALPDALPWQDIPPGVYRTRSDTWRQ